MASRSSSPASVSGTAVDNSATQPDATPAPQIASLCSTRESDAPNACSELPDVISRRIAAKEFPVVLPSEVEAIMQAQAADSLAWVKKDESVRIQSYIDYKYKSYRECLPSSDVRPEAVIHADWARLFYYHHLRAWLAQNDASGSQDEFISALPVPLLPEDRRAQAESLLSQMDSSKHVLFQNAVQAELREFLELLPSSSSHAETDVLRDAWYTDRYYSIMGAFLDGQVETQFHPMLAADQIPAEERPGYVSLCAEMTCDDELHFHRQVNANWDVVWQKMPKGSSLTSQQELIKMNWLARNYVALLTSYLAEKRVVKVAAFVYSPVVSPEALPTDDQRAEAVELLSEVRPFHVDLIDKAVAHGWQQFRQRMPQGLPETVLSSLHQKWLVQNYYPVLARVLGDSVQDSEFVFVPAVPLSELSGVAQQEKYAKLLKLVTPSLAEALRVRVDELRMETFQNCDLGEVREVVEQHWLAENYYVLLEQVVRDFPVRIVCSDVKPTHERDSENNLPSMFSSPKKRARVQPDLSTCHALVTRSIAECHLTDMGIIDANRAEVYLLYFSENLRWVDVKDRKSGVVEKVPVLTCVFGDCTAVIQGDLWRDRAETYLTRFQEWCGVAEEPVLLELSHFGVKKENRRSLVATRQLAFNNKSVLSRIAVPSSSCFLGLGVQLSDELIITDFSRISGPLPCFLNLSGYVTQVSGISQSRQDVSMLNFRLQDRSGKYLSCCAHGRHSANDAIQEKAHIVLFLASAASSGAGYPPVVWVYDNSHIVLRRRNCILPPQTESVTIVTSSPAASSASAVQGA
jgi:hypothetical protein